MARIGGATRLAESGRHGTDPEPQRCRRYREGLTHSEGGSVDPLNLGVADEAVWLRAEHCLRAPDAIQIATATTCGAHLFLTNDRQLARSPGIEVVTVADLAA